MIIHLSLTTVRQTLLIIVLCFLSFQAGYHLYTPSYAAEDPGQGASNYPMPGADAQAFASCVGSTLGGYMNAILTDVKQSNYADRVKVTTPIFNCTSETCSAIIYDMYQNGADFTNVDALIMNVYAIGDNNIEDFLDQKFAEINRYDPQLAQILTNVPLVFGEVGLQDDVDPEAFNQSLINLQNGTYYQSGPSFGSNSGTNPVIHIFNRDGLNGQFMDQVNNYCQNGYDCSQYGTNAAVYVRDAKDSCSNSNCVVIIGGMGDLNAAIELIKNSPSGNVTLRQCVGESCGFTQASTYQNFLELLAEGTCDDAGNCKSFSVVAGPNEPDLEPWLTPECGTYLQALLGGQQCTSGEQSPYTSRTSECASCFNYVPDPTLACAGDFTYNKLLPYSSFDIMNCNFNQCSFNVDNCSVQLGEKPVEDMGELNASTQLLVGPLPWQGRFSLNAESTILPFAGNDKEESRERYIADYLDGVIYYKSDIDPGSQLPAISDDPVEIYDRQATQYYDLPPLDPRYFSYAGVIQKLAPQALIDELRHDLLSRVHSNDYTTILLPINDYSLRAYTGETSHLDKFIDEPNVAGSQDRAHIKPRPEDYNGYTPEYWQAYQAWQALDDGKWFRLWSYIPLTTRQDTPGTFEPQIQTPYGNLIHRSDASVNNQSLAQDQRLAAATSFSPNKELAVIPIDPGAPPDAIPTPTFSPDNTRLQTGQQDQNVFGQPSANRPSSNLLPYPSPVQLQFPHLGRLYESSLILNGLLSPYQSGYRTAQAPPDQPASGVAMASSQPFSPSQTQLAQAGLDPGTNTGQDGIPAQCVTDPPGCFENADGKGCFNVEVTIDGYQDGQVHYGIRAQQTCSEITGGIGDCDFRVVGFNQVHVQTIPPLPGATDIHSYNIPNTLPPINVGLPQPGVAVREGSVTVSVECRRDIATNDCCSRYKQVTCNVSVDSNNQIIDSNCNPSTYTPPAPAACQPTILGSLPRCDGILRAGPGDNLCGVDTWDFTIDAPNDTFWNTNPFTTQTVNNDGSIRNTNADGSTQFDDQFTAAQCGLTIGCDECNCTGERHQTNCRYDPLSGQLVDCDNYCCVPGTWNGSSCGEYPESATPNLCEDPGYSCKTDNDIPACYASPYGSDQILSDQNYTPIYGQSVLTPNVQLTHQSYREVLLQTQIPYLGSIYDFLVGDPSQPGDGSTQRYSSMTSPTYRMFTPYRGVKTPTDPVPWYKYHGGSASGTLSVANLGGAGTDINGAGAGITTPFFFPFLGGIQDGTQFVRDCLTATWPNGCTPPQIKELIEGVTCSANFAKLSFYANSVDQDLLSFVTQAKPTTIKLMDAALDQSDKIYQASPQTKIIGRVFSDNYNGINGVSESDFSNLATARDKAQQWFSQHQDKINQYSHVSYWEGYNEPVADDATHMRWLAEFELERMKLLDNAGSKACIGNFAVGNPNPELWPEFSPAFEYAAANDHPVCLHEYAKAPDFAVDTFLLGRFESMYEYLGSDNVRLSNQIQTIISETGVTGSGAASSGWRKILDNDSQRFLEIMQAYDKYITSESPYANQILGATLYIYGHAGWPNQEMKPDIINAFLTGVSSGSDAGSLSCLANHDNFGITGSFGNTKCFQYDNSFNQYPEYKNRLASQINELAQRHPGYIGRVCSSNQDINFVLKAEANPGYWAEWQDTNTLFLWESTFQTDIGTYFTITHELGHRLRINRAPNGSTYGDIFAQEVLCQPGETTNCEDHLPDYPRRFPDYFKNNSLSEDFSETIAWYAMAQRYPGACHWRFSDGSRYCYTQIGQQYPIHYDFARQLMNP